MTPYQQHVYDTVHKWCDEQTNEIPDAKRRYYMDKVLASDYRLEIIANEPHMVDKLNIHAVRLSYFLK
jgi:hypothetical protein